MSSRIKVTPNNEDLFELVRDAGTGKIALPQFQRSFVWQAEDIRDLLVSVFKGYFIGSLLMLDMDSHDPPFSVRGVEGSNLELDALTGVSSRLLLDGQQRITSLYYAFTSPEIPLKGRSKQPTIFFVDLKKLFDDDVDNAVTFKSKSRCKDEELETGEWQFEKLIVPLAHVASVMSWSKWKFEYQQWLFSKDSERFNNWMETEQGHWDNVLYSIWHYSQPVLSLARIDPGESRQLEEICTVFEKLNSTGISLSVFDLLTARLYPQGVNLDELWQDALEQCDHLRMFDADRSDFGVFLLRMIALKRGQDIKGKALISLSKEKFGEDWELAVQYLNGAFDRLTSLQEDGFGVFNPKWLPSKTMIPLLGALLAKRDSLPSKKRAFATKVIHWWYWGSTFIARYSGPTESISQRDYVALTQYMASHEAAYPQVLREIHMEVLRKGSEFSILSVERASNIFYKAVMCLLAVNGAQDFRNFESITYSQLDDHHIFPTAYLKESLVDNPYGLSDTGARNTIVNRTLISAETNRAIGKKAPSLYICDEAIIAPDNARDILYRHFINDDALQYLQQDNYPLFLRERERAIIAKIRSIFKDMPVPPRHDDVN